MQSTAVVALALLESVSAFQAPVMPSRPIQLILLDSLLQESEIQSTKS